jgi:hypothetical protein
MLILCVCARTFTNKFETIYIYICIEKTASEYRGIYILEMRQI